MWEKLTPCGQIALILLQVKKTTSAGSSFTPITYFALFSTDQKTIFTKDWNVVHFHYPNNHPYNAESILIDSKTREFIIVTKSAEPPYAKVFKTNLDSEMTTYNVMTDTGITLALSEATDATSSKDGQVLIEKYEL